MPSSGGDADVARGVSLAGQSVTGALGPATIDKPARAVDGNQRLEALRSLGLLDTPPEERFDVLTRLARRLLEVPTALVSLVDDQRQWFKSADGLAKRELPRAVSFCGHAIHGNDILYVPDATRDARFADNPLVTHDPCIRFYAGCPLITSDGYTLGTPCIIDYQPRQLDAQELERPPQETD